MSAIACQDNFASLVESRWQRIKEKLEAHEGILAKRGILSSKVVNGRTIWRVRFRAPREGGGMIRRTIYIGTNPELVERVRRLLRTFREGTVLAKETAGLVKMAMAVCARLRRGVLRVSHANRKAST